VADPGPRSSVPRSHPTNRYERLNALLELLTESGHVDVETLSHDLHVSNATVRRDLDQLAHQQLLTRTRGGAVLNNVNYDLPLRYKTARHASEKQRVGHAAAALVQRGAVIGLNGGTTATEVARALATRTDPGGSPETPTVTVVTNALNIAWELAVRRHIKIVVTGGAARPQSYELIGPLAGRILEDVSLDVVFLGVDAVDPVGGAMAHHEGEAAISAMMAAHAQRVVVVTDASKLGHRAFARICPATDITTLVTDTAADDAIVARFRELGVEVLLV
jgi:DeoR family transcriptional regulator, aga operon transcriptional repressor